MRPIPAPRIGDSHGLLRAIDERERVRLDEFVTEFSVDDLFPPGLENALGRTRQFVSFARAAGLLKEDRGTVELTEIGRRYVRAGDAERPFDVSPGQAEWLRRQLREKHMTDSIFHGLAIGLSLLASAPGAKVSTLDFGRALGYLGRAGWDNDNTLQIQGERHITLLRDLELLNGERGLTQTGQQVKSELTLPVHMSLIDIAAQLNPGGPDAVHAAGEAEWAATEAEAPAGETAAAEPEAAAASEAPPAAADDEYADVGPGAWVEAPAEPEPEPAPPEPEPVAAAPEPEPAPEAPSPPVPPSDIWDVAAPDEPTRAYAAVEPPEPPAAEPPEAEPEAPPEPEPAAPTGMTSGDPLAEPATPPSDPADAATVISTPTPPRPPAVAPPVEPPPPAEPAPPVEPPPAEPPRPVEPPSPAEPPRPAEPSPAAPAAPVSGLRRTGRFVDAADVQSAAESQGLRMDPAVYANVAAALAAGRHVVLVGPPGAGKTALALAVAKAAVDAGKAEGAALVPGSQDELATQVHEAARRNRWLVVDDLDAAALAPLSTFLSHLPVTLAGEGEVAAPAEWRIVATAAAVEDAPPEVLGRLAVVEVSEHEDLEAALIEAAGGDAVAAAAVARLLPLRELAPIGAGAFLAAARHAAERRATADADEATLAREVHTAYLAPLLGGLDVAGQAGVRELLGGS